MAGMMLSLVMLLCDSQGDYTVDGCVQWVSSVEKRDRRLDQRYISCGSSSSRAAASSGWGVT